MKPIKMFGLAVLAALMAMAFVGADSAMAEETQLCKLDSVGNIGEKCPAGEAITSVHTVSVGKALIAATPSVECNVLSATTSVGALAAPQVLKAHYTYTNCGCTVKEKAGTTAQEKILKLGHETADITLTWEIVLESCFGIDCTYTGTELKATVKGPLLSTEENGEVNLSEQELNGKGAFCPSKAKLSIKTTPLAATYIAK
jgi:hypothetical protein